MPMISIHLKNIWCTSRYQCYMMIYFDIFWYIISYLFSHLHIETGLSRASWQDAYYLLEIDPWGRRFYHRGGMRTGAAGDVAFSGGSGSTYSERRVQGATNLRHFFIFSQPCHDRSNTYSLTGWCFGTFGLFFHSVGNVIIPTDELHHFSEGQVYHQPVYH